MEGGADSQVKSFSDPSWVKLMPKVRHALTHLALQGYQQAPAVQQALCLMELAIKNAQEAKYDLAWQYLALGTRAADQAARLSDSVIASGQLRGDRNYKSRHAGLGRAVAYMTFSAQSCESYLRSPNPAKLARAKLRLEDAAMTVAGTVLLG